MTSLALEPSEAWGLGPAKLVKRATKQATETVVFISDIHVPYHDDAALVSALALIKHLEPHRVVINGDIADFFQLSRFNNGLERLDTLQAEIDLANKVRAAVRNAAPNALIEETEGNHCSRLRTYVQNNARSLTSLHALRPENLNDWAENEIRPHGSNGFRLRPDFLVKHGTMVRGEGGATAKAEQASAGINGVSGHTHRLARYRKDGYSIREWSEGGCLCRLDPDYVATPNWQHGLLVGHFSTKSLAFIVDHVQAINGRFRYGGVAH